jgi:photosystem II stability/assembly factor-like uncharacterized protein
MNRFFWIQFHIALVTSVAFHPVLLPQSMPWEPLVPLPASIIFQIAVDGTGGIYVAADSGFFRSSDRGNSWNMIYPDNYHYPLPPPKMILDESDFIYVQSSAGPNGVFRSTDSGSSWTWVASWTAELRMGSNRNLVAVQDTQILLSSDHGSQWQTYLLSGPVLRANFTSIAFPETDYVFLTYKYYYPHGAAETALMRSIDNGLSWTKISSSGDPTISYRHLDVDTRGFIYVFIGNVVCCFWNHGQNSQGIIGAKDLVVVRGDTIMAATTSGVGGVLLTRFVPGNPNIWYAFNYGLPSPNTTVVAVDAQNNIYTAIGGTVYRNTSLGTPVVSVHEGPPPFSYSLEQNYPNPFNPTTSIKFQISSTSFVSLKVFDVLGKEIATLVNESKEPGMYTASWDAGNITSGLYFYRLSAGSLVATRKMLLLK